MSFLFLFTNLPELILKIKVFRDLELADWVQWALAKADCFDPTVDAWSLQDFACSIKITFYEFYLLYIIQCNFKFSSFSNCSINAMSDLLCPDPMKTMA